MLLASGPSVPCCDICDPSLLDRTRPGITSGTKRPLRVKRGKPSTLVLDELHAWRIRVKARDFPGSMFSAESILADNVLELLATVGPIATEARLSAILNGQWGWETTYRDELFVLLSNLDIPAFEPLEGKKRVTNTRRTHEDVEEGRGLGQAAKKAKLVEVDPNIPADMQFSFEIGDYGHSAHLNSASTFTSTFPIAGYIHNFPRVSNVWVAGLRRLDVDLDGANASDSEPAGM